jgi:hypothetical protein
MSVTLFGTRIFRSLVTVLTMGGERVVGDGEWLTIGEMQKALGGISDTTARDYADAGKVVHNGVEYRLRTVRLPGRHGHRRVNAADVEVIRRAIYGDDSSPAPDEQDQ